jgi:hypothetical protein
VYPNPEPATARRPNDTGDDADLDAAWQALRGPADRAFLAAEQFVRVGDRAVGFLRAKLHPSFAREPEDIRRLISELDNDAVGVRIKARSNILERGLAAAPFLAERLRQTDNLQLKDEIGFLLAMATAPKVSDRDQLRDVRAICALEWIDTENARALLATLATGTPGARLTVEANYVLTGGRKPSRGKTSE